MTAPRIFTATIQAAQAGVPAYLNGKPDWEWVGVAGDNALGTGTSLYSQVPALTAFESSTYIANSIASWLDSWTGGSVDQSRKELLRVADGGHVSYHGEEGYALNLGEDSPRWRRLTTRTTLNQQSLTPRNPVYGEFHQFWTDAGQPTGRPQSMHHCALVQYQNGRVWFLGNNATAGQNGSSTWPGNWQLPATLSWDRDLAATRAGAGYSGYPLSYASSDLWRNHGVGYPRTSGNYLGLSSFFNVSASDPANNKVYGFVSDSGMTGTHYWVTDTTPGANEATRTTAVAIPAGQQHNWAWAVCCPDLGGILLGRRDTSQVWHLSTSTGIFTQVTGAGIANNLVWQNGWAAGLFQYSYQPAYHAPSRSLFFFGATRLPTFDKVRRLKIPVTGSAINLTGTWAWSEIPVGGAAVSSWTDLGSGQDVYGRFNIINDVGGGQAVLVLNRRWNEATYVCKIPTGFT